MKFRAILFVLVFYFYVTSYFSQDSTNKIIIHQITVDIQANAPEEYSKNHSSRLIYYKQPALKLNYGFRRFTKSALIIGGSIALYKREGEGFITDGSNSTSYMKSGSFQFIACEFSGLIGGWLGGKKKNMFGFGLSIGKNCWQKGVVKFSGFSHNGFESSESSDLSKILNTEHYSIYQEFNGLISLSKNKKLILGSKIYLASPDCIFSKRNIGISLTVGYAVYNK